MATRHSHPRHRATAVNSSPSTEGSPCGGQAGHNPACSFFQDRDGPLEQREWRRWQLSRSTANLSVPSSAGNSVSTSRVLLLEKRVKEAASNVPGGSCRVPLASRPRISSGVDPRSRCRHSVGDRAGQRLRGPVRAQDPSRITCQACATSPAGPVTSRASRSSVRRSFMPHSRWLKNP